VLILFDATYQSFITDSTLPQTIYEIKGAKKVAVEFRSFSKNAGFTGLNCGYTIIPKDIAGYSFAADRSANLNLLWRKRQTIKNYTPPYIIQKGAEALFSDEGLNGIRENVEYYMSNAEILRRSLTDAKLKFWGGVNSPYIWVESPYGSSWKLFNKLLEECHILSSPGERFGSGGKGFVRISSFANQTKVMMAATRIADMKL
jgi:LL-diaminopimelate aminotransferase